MLGTAGKGGADLQRKTGWGKVGRVPFGPYWFARRGTIGTRLQAIGNAQHRKSDATCAQLKHAVALLLADQEAGSLEDFEALNAHKAPLLLRWLGL